MRIARYFALALLALAAVPAGVAFAQYPEPLGVCTASGPGSIAPNTIATFTVTTQTANGAPAPGVSGTATLASGSGTVLTPTFTTNAQGTASVQVQAGANPGTISLNITCGALQTTGVVSVSSPSVQPKPPDTGLGTSETSNGSLPLLWVLAGVTLVGAAGAAGATAVVRRK